MRLKSRHIKLGTLKNEAVNLKNRSFDKEYELTEVM